MILSFTERLFGHSDPLRQALACRAQWLAPIIAYEKSLLLLLSFILHSIH